MSYLSNLILEQLYKTPNLSAIQLAMNLDVPQKVIMHRLENNLENIVFQNKNTTWTVLENREVRVQNKTEKIEMT